MLGPCGGWIFFPSPFSSSLQTCTETLQTPVPSSGMAGWLWDSMLVPCSAWDFFSPHFSSSPQPLDAGVMLSCGTVPVVPGFVTLGAGAHPRERHQAPPAPQRMFPVSCSEQLTRMQVPRPSSPQLPEGDVLIEAEAVVTLLLRHVAPLLPARHKPIGTAVSPGSPTCIPPFPRSHCLRTEGHQELLSCRHIHLQSSHPRAKQEVP